MHTVVCLMKLPSLEHLFPLLTYAASMLGHSWNTTLSHYSAYPYRYWLCLLPSVCYFEAVQQSCWNTLAWLVPWLLHSCFLDQICPFCLHYNWNLSTFAHSPRQPNCLLGWPWTFLPECCVFAHLSVYWMLLHVCLLVCAWCVSVIIAQNNTHLSTEYWWLPMLTKALRESIGHQVQPGLRCCHKNPMHFPSRKVEQEKWSCSWIDILLHSMYLFLSHCKQIRIHTFLILYTTQSRTVTQVKNNALQNANANANMCLERRWFILVTGRKSQGRVSKACQTQSSLRIALFLPKVNVRGWTHFSGTATNWSNSTVTENQI